LWNGHRACSSISSLFERAISVSVIARRRVVGGDEVILSQAMLRRTLRTMTAPIAANQRSLEGRATLSAIA
jgi:hypothetical protein